MNSSSCPHAWRETSEQTRDGKMHIWRCESCGARRVPPPGPTLQALIDSFQPMRTAESAKSVPHASASVGEHPDDPQDSMIVVELREQLRTLQHQQQEAETTINAWRQRYSELVKTTSGDYHDQLSSAHTVTALHAKLEEAETTITALRLQCETLYGQKLVEAETTIKELQAVLQSGQAYQQLREHPGQCPTWYDGCNCTVENLLRNIERADAAEKQLTEAETTIATLTQDRDEARDTLYGYDEMGGAAGIEDAARDALLDQVLAIVDYYATPKSLALGVMRDKIAALRAQPPADGVTLKGHHG